MTNTTNTAAASFVITKHYAKRDPEAQGDHYIKHVSAMTTEGLHAKSDIAAELAHRDIEIERLRAALAAPRNATLYDPHDVAFPAPRSADEGDALPPELTSTAKPASTAAMEVLRERIEALQSEKESLHAALVKESIRAANERLRADKMALQHRIQALESKP